MSSFHTSDIYTRPYIIPLPVLEDGRRLGLTRDVLFYISEGAITEYLAYIQGLPATPFLVNSFLNLTGWVQQKKWDKHKSLGSVVFQCSNGEYRSCYDLSTLARTFEL